MSGPANRRALFVRKMLTKLVNGALVVFWHPIGYTDHDLRCYSGIDMRRIVSISAIIGAALFAAGCTSFTQEQYGEKIDSLYTVGGGEWDDGSQLYVLIRIFQEQDRVALCGAWTTAGTTVQSLFKNENVIETGVLQIEDDWIMQGFQILPQVDFADDMTGKPARCHTTEARWKESYARAKPTIRFARQPFTEGGDKQTDAFVFRQAPVLRIIR